MRRIKYCIIVLAVSVLFLNNSLSKAEERILAIVGREVITSKDLEDFMNFMRLSRQEDRENQNLEEELSKRKPELLERLIEDRLILQEARRQKIEVDKNILRAKVEEIRRRYPSDIQFQEALNAQGLNLSDIEKRIEEQMLIYSAVDKNIRTKIVVHPQEVTEYYQKHSQDFIESEKRDVLAMISDDKKELDTIKEKLKDQGIDDILKRYPLNIKELGMVKRGELKKEFEDIVFSLKEREASDIINVDDRYYIFLVRKIMPPYQKSFEEVQYRVYTLLFEEKLEQNLKQWLEDLRKKTYVQIKKD